MDQCKIRVTNDCDPKERERYIAILKARNIKFVYPVVNIISPANIVALYDAMQKSMIDLKKIEQLADAYEQMITGGKIYADELIMALNPREEPDTPTVTVVSNKPYFRQHERW